MNFIYLGNDLFAKIVLIGVSVNKYNLTAQPTIKNVIVDNKQVYVFIDTHGFTFENIKMELEIYYTEEKRRDMRITKEDGDYIDYRIRRNVENIRSFGDKGDFVLVTEADDEASTLKKIYGQCKLIITTWSFVPEKCRHYCGMVIDGARTESSVLSRTETDGGAGVAHFAVTGKPSQHFTSAPFFERNENSRYSIVMKFFVC